MLIRKILNNLTCAHNSCFVKSCSMYCMLYNHYTLKKNRLKNSSNPKMTMTFMPLIRICKVITITVIEYQVDKSVGSDEIILSFRNVTN